MVFEIFEKFPFERLRIPERLAGRKPGDVAQKKRIVARFEASQATLAERASGFEEKVRGRAGNVFSAPDAFPERKRVTRKVHDVPYPTDERVVFVRAAIENFQGLFRIAELDFLGNSRGHAAQKDFGDYARHRGTFEVLPQIRKPFDEGRFADEVQIAFPGIVENDFAFGERVERALKRAVFGSRAFHKERLHAEIPRKTFHDERGFPIRRSVEDDDLGTFQHLGFGPETVVETLSPENVTVDVRNRLAGVALGVEYETRSAFFEAFLFRDALRNEKQPPEQRGILLLHVEKARDVLFRNDEHVHGSLRIQIPERVKFVIFVNLVRRDFAPDDFAKNAVGHNYLPDGVFPKINFLEWPWQMGGESP